LIEITETSTFSAAEAAQLSDGESDPYGTNHLAISWAPKDHQVCFSEAGRLVAHAGYLLIDVEADGVRIPGVGLGSVMVHPSLRGQGIGARLVQETTDRMKMTGRPFALLFCREIRLPFYRRLGWRRVDPEVSVEQEHELMTMSLLTCWFSFEQDCIAPSNRLRVLGPPF
jgi:GNAT superfamily N-acetyltransferase